MTELELVNCADAPINADGFRDTIYDNEMIKEEVKFEQWKETNYLPKDFLCPKDSVNMTLSGQFHSNVFQYFQISVMGCQLDDQSQCYQVDSDDGTDSAIFEMLDTAMFLQMDEWNHTAMRKTRLDSTTFFNMSLSMGQRSDQYFMNSLV